MHLRLQSREFASCSQRLLRIPNDFLKDLGQERIRIAWNRLRWPACDTLQEDLTGP